MARNPRHLRLQGLLAMAFISFAPGAASSHRLSPVLAGRQDALSVSTNGSCGADTGFGCLGSRFGDCCSRNGFCGSETTFCGAGCREGFGSCGDDSVSSDGSCGGRDGLTCQGSEFGNCCSRLGFCGSNSSFCGDGCQSGFGTCLNVGGDRQPVSSDGSCGPSNNVTCQGSEYGNCCSLKGFCGADDAFCATGCQSDFGTCFPAPDNAPGDADKPDSGGGMSTGAKAGAAIGGAAGAVLLGIVGVLFWHRKKSKKSASRNEAGLATAEITPTAGPAVRNNKVAFPKQDIVHELYSPPQEMSAEQAPAELGDTRAAAVGRAR